MEEDNFCNEKTWKLATVKILEKSFHSCGIKMIYLKMFPVQKREKEDKEREMYLVFVGNDDKSDNVDRKIKEH